jgi:hypothetical protein
VVVVDGPKRMGFAEAFFKVERTAETTKSCEGCFETSKNSFSFIPIQRVFSVTSFGFIHIVYKKWSVEMKERRPDSDSFLGDEKSLKAFDEKKKILDQS